MGPRLPAELSLYEVVQSSANGLTKFLVPQLPRGWPTLVLFAVILAAMLASLTIRRAVPAAVLGLAGLGITVLSAATTHLFWVESRLFLPTIPPLIAIGAVAFAKAEGLLKSETRQLSRFAVFGAAVVFLLVSIPSEVNRVFNATKGFGYSSPKWRNSETLRRADVLPKGADVYTNFPELFYLHLNQKSVSFTPFWTDSAFARYFHWDVEWWRERISRSNRPKIIVWFEGRRGGDMLTPDAMSKIVPLELLEEYREEAIYRVVTVARHRD